MIAERVVESGCSGKLRGSSRGDQPRAAGGPLVLAAVIVCTVAAVGCKSGTSMTKPSWWSFGGGGGDTAKLASAPTFSGDAKKPSETNAPYPTTSTPNGYVITGSTAPGSGAAAPAAQAAVPIGPVVYGSTPSPAAAAAAAPTAAPAAGPAGGVAAAQTGPYATLAGEQIPPPGQPLPPLAPLSSAPAPASTAMPAASAFTSTADMPAAGALPYRAAEPSAAASGYSNFSGGAAAGTPLPAAAAAEQPAARMADNRAFDPAAGMQPAVTAGDAGAAYGGSRYATQSASRFTSGGPTSASPASYGQPPADAAFPPADASLPSSSPAADMPLSQPGSPGLLPQSSQPPVRRPDPGYRPFKTGSYRPSRTILADESAPLPGEVRTASYDEPAIGTVQR